MTVLFFIHSLSNSAGTERITCDLANLLAEHGYGVQIISLVDDMQSFFPLNEQIKQFSLKNISSIKGNRITAARQLRRLLKTERPDVLINVDTAMVQISSLAMPQTLGIRTITWEHFSLMGGILQKAKRYLAALTSTLVVLTEADKKNYPPLLRARLQVIPNFSRLNREGHRAKTDTKTVVAIGRLVPAKGFELLIQAWAKVVPGYAGWICEIWGEGREDYKQRLEKLRGEVGLTSELLQLKGATKDIAQVYEKASQYVCSSLQESFGLSIIEAQSYGGPVISFDCPCGQQRSYTLVWMDCWSRMAR